MSSDRVSRPLLIAVLAIGLIGAVPHVGAALDPGGTFSDDNVSIHEGAIEAIAAAGITRGCNPPVNDLFCPTATVTRQQMASFLVRALDLPAGSTSFNDIADSIHAADISALADAGITKGCNPPANDMFCPHDPVTREQMASFMARALGLPVIDPPPPLPFPSPSPLVDYGTGNWLFFSETVSQACLEVQLFRRATEELEKAKTVVEASGRGFVYAVPPNKAATHSEHLVAGTWAGSCAAANSAALQAALTAADDPNRADLWAPFAAAAANGQLYFKHDTHWNAAGALLGSELIASLAAPGVWNGLQIVDEPASRQGDLADIIGVDWVVEYDELMPTLDGVTPVVTVESVTISGRPLVTYSSPSNPKLSRLSTAVIHDSFGLFFRNKLGPLFEEVTFLPTFSHPIADEARVFLTGTEQIVLEVVERNLLRDLLGTGTAGHLAAALADGFAQSPVTFTRDGGAVDFSLPAGNLEDLRYLVVEAETAATVVIGSSSDFGGPAWPNEITPEASRYGFEIVDTSTTLRLPLPASVDVISAFVVVIE